MEFTEEAKAEPACSLKQRNFGVSAAHSVFPVPLLPSGPGGVRGTSLHEARSSTTSQWQACHCKQKFSTASAPSRKLAAKLFDPPSRKTLLKWTHSLSLAPLRQELPSYTSFRLEFLLNRLGLPAAVQGPRASARFHPLGPSPHVTGNRCTTVHAGGSS